MCGVGGGGRAGAIDDIGPIKSDRPPPSSEAPPVTEIIQHRGEHASRRYGAGGAIHTPIMFASHRRENGSDAMAINHFH